MNLIPVNEAKAQLARIIAVLPRGASTWPCKMLVSGMIIRILAFGDELVTKFAIKTFPNNMIVSQVNSKIKESEIRF